MTCSSRIVMLIPRATAGRSRGRSAAIGGRSTGGISVVIDARILSPRDDWDRGPGAGGHRRPGPDRTGSPHRGRSRPAAAVRRRGARVFPEVELVRSNEALASIRGDLVHRPYQVSNPGDVAFLAALGERLILTNQDLIGYHNHAYFEDADAWLAYRRLTRPRSRSPTAWCSCPRTAAQDAIAEDLVEPSRSDVVHNGVDHSVASPQRTGTGSASYRSTSEVILCLGTDYRHKNRPFALRILEELRTRHGWTGTARVRRAPREGRIVPRRGGRSAGEASRAGGGRDRPRGRERSAEGVATAPRPARRLPHDVRGVRACPVRGRRVRARRACGRPEPRSARCFPTAPPGSCPGMPPPARTRALALLRDDEARARQFAVVRDAARGLTWDATAASLLELYAAACDAPPPPLSALERAQGLMSGTISDDALRLVGPGGVLPSGLERPLLALSTHPQLRQARVRRPEARLSRAAAGRDLEPQCAPASCGRGRTPAACGGGESAWSGSTSLPDQPLRSDLRRPIRDGASPRRARTRPRHPAWRRRRQRSSSSLYRNRFSSKPPIAAYAACSTSIAAPETQATAVGTCVSRQ